MFSAFVDAVIAIAKAINAILSVIPGLVWGIALLLALLWGGLMHHERDSAISAREVVEKSYAQLSANVIHQKNVAAALLRTLTAERDALQARINEAHNAQEKKDANNQAVIADQSRRLRALERDGRLRDPNAAGCGRGGPGPEGAAAAPAGDRAAGPAEAGGVLSTQLSGLLQRLTRESDDINAAYESARTDALTCRAALGASP